MSSKRKKMDKSSMKTAKPSKTDNTSVSSVKGKGQELSKKDKEKNLSTKKQRSTKKTEPKVVTKPQLIDGDGSKSEKKKVKSLRKIEDDSEEPSNNPLEGAFTPHLLSVGDSKTGPKFDDVETDGFQNPAPYATNLKPGETIAGKLVTASGDLLQFLPGELGDKYRQSQEGVLAMNRNLKTIFYKKYGFFKPDENGDPVLQRVPQIPVEQAQSGEHGLYAEPLTVDIAGYPQHLKRRKEIQDARILKKLKGINQTKYEADEKLKEVNKLKVSLEVQLAKGNSTEKQDNGETKDKPKEKPGEKSKEEPEVKDSEKPDGKVKKDKEVNVKENSEEKLKDKPEEKAKKKSEKANVKENPEEKLKDNPEDKAKQKPEKAKVKENPEEKLQETQPMDEKENTASNGKETEKKKDRYCLWNKKCFIIAGIVAVVLIVIASVCLYMANNDSSSSSDLHSPNTTKLPSADSDNSTGASKPTNETSATTASMSTTTKAYPALTPVKRKPVVHLAKPTYDIVFAQLFLKIKKLNPTSFEASTVTFGLTITDTTENIQLHCGVHEVSNVFMTYVNETGMEPLKLITHNKETQLLTIKMPKLIGRTTVLIQIFYTPLDEAFERISFPCDQKNCTVLTNRQLNLIVPHFDHFSTHSWNIVIRHPPNTLVLINSGPNNTETSPDTTTTTYKETQYLQPNELSFVINENLMHKAYGSQIVTLSSSSEAQKVAALVSTLEQALASYTKPSNIQKEKFYIVYIPVMKNYRYYGRNIVFVGLELLGSNNEIRLIFVWEWIFRMIVYSKISSSDKNPAWIYDQSAVFLSTIIKSNNTEKWQKHFYESVMDFDHPATNGLITYQDEQRYFEKPEHVAKVSTILAMITTLGPAISGDPLTKLNEARDDSTSAKFFFVNALLEVGKGQKLQVDGVTSCYVDSPDVPLVHFTRISPSKVAIQRYTAVQGKGCDAHLWIVRGNANKEHVLLTAADDKREFESSSPLLLSGDSPFPAYRYTMDQAEFEKLLDPALLASYDDATVNLLATNAFVAAVEGKLGYKSLKRFMSMDLIRKVVSVDEAVDLWMWTVRQSRNRTLTSFTNKIVSFVLNPSADTSDSTKVVDYIVARYQKSLSEAPMFEIERAKELMRNCGKPCLIKILGDNFDTESCVSGGTKDCSYNPSSLETYACLMVAVGDAEKYNKFADLYGKCSGKPCLLPILRGLLCTGSRENLEMWLNQTQSLSSEDMVENQMLKNIFMGLASNEVSKPLLFPYLTETWHLIHQKHYNNPDLLGDITDSLLSTITTPEQLEELKQFVAFHGDRLQMFGEFENQVVKAERAVKWNKKCSEEFTRLFV